MKELRLRYRDGAFEVYDGHSRELDGHLEVSFKDRERVETYAYRPINGARRPPAASIPAALKIHFGDRIAITVEPIL